MNTKTIMIEKSDLTAAAIEMGLWDSILETCSDKNLKECANKVDVQVMLTVSESVAS